MSLCAVLSGVRRTRKMSFLETSRYRTISSTTRAVTPLRMIAIFAAAGVSRTTNAVKPVGLLPGARRNCFAECFGFMRQSPPEILAPYREIDNSHFGDRARAPAAAEPPSDQQRQWFLDELGERAEELSPPGAVEGAV